MQIAYRFRLYPLRAVQEKLRSHVELCRWLYNRLLKELNRAREEKIKLAQKCTQALIVRLKEEKPELKEVYSKVLQMVNHQLWSNIRALAQLKKNGKNVGRLRFKGRGWFKTMNYNQSGFKLKGKSLILSKVGAIPMKLHREVKGKIKGVIVKRERSGKWHVTFQAEDEPKTLPKTGKVIGTDLGIKRFLTDSDRSQIKKSGLIS